MRKTLLTFAALAGLAGAATTAPASAATVGLDTVPAAALVQPVQYYGYHHDWHHRYWAHRRWVEYHRWHHYGYRRW